MTHLEEAQLQLSEVEVLESIYPNKNEIVVSNRDDFMLMKQFVETDGASFPPSKKLNILINLKIENSCNIKVEVTLPKDYPLGSLPQVFLRCDCMTRNIQQQFNEDLQTYIHSIEVGETCLYQILQWVAHHTKRYIDSSNSHTDQQMAKESPKSHSCTFIRLWIYSHHIYNKQKRKSILEWAKELELTGFCMPGKPGIICVEGMQEKCDEYWHRLRRQTWKRLSIVHREEIGSSGEEFERNKKFLDVVAEKDFGVHGGRDYHMDLGEFFKFLTDHSCQDIFPLLFGVEGKTSDKT